MKWYWLSGVTVLLGPLFLASSATLLLKSGKLSMLCCFFHELSWHLKDAVKHGCMLLLGTTLNTSMTNVFICLFPFLRKKKLTEHWQRFIRPIMWRCKWIELQIKEMKSQALKYDTKLAQYDQRKEVELENSMLEGFDESSQSFSSHNIRGNQVMKRKKRKRVEEKTDVASYMSQHNLFSYYGMNYEVHNSCFLLGLFICFKSNRYLLLVFLSQSIRGPLLIVLSWKMIMVTEVRSKNFALSLNFGELYSLQRS